jgi:hypothetical protein
VNDEKRTDLPQLLDALHQLLLVELGIARTTIGHSGTKGEVSEGRWIEMLQHHLPSRYQVSKAFVIDSRNQCSDQIDIVIHDRQYSPFVLKFGTAIYVPAESVYGVFEVKQEMSATEVEYAGSKIASVRKLHRTSIPIEHAGGTYPAKAVQPILGGLLCLKSSWAEPFGETFLEHLKKLSPEGILNLGCAAENGVFEVDYVDSKKLDVKVHDRRSPLAYFLLRLIAKLQGMATVPCLDVMAYAHWLDKV